MKQFLFTAIAFLLAHSLSAQDIKKVRGFYDKKDWAKAKEAVDLMMANEKEQKNWEGWYYKGMIYGQLATDANFKAANPEVWMQSFDAYQKAYEMDPKQTETFMTLRSFPIFSNYLELQKEGNDFYNKQNYINALQKYKEADQVGRFIFKNKWALSEVDTVLYYYAGAAAMQAEKNDEAISFFQKICDASIGGEGYDICYRFVTYHYDSKKDYVTADKYAAVGRKLYPADSYYSKLELDRERKNAGVGPELFKKYEVVLQSDAKDYDIRFDYAAEIFNWIFTDQKAPTGEKQKYLDKIAEQLKLCIQAQPKKPEAHLLMGKMFYNEAAALQDELRTIKGTTPADTQKKTDMKVKMEGLMKEAIPNLENGLAIFDKMSAEELKDRRTKNEFKSTLYLLTEAYKFMGNTEKEKFYQTKYDSLNQ